MTDIDTLFYRFNPSSQYPAVPPVEGFDKLEMWFMHINKTGGSVVKKWFKANELPLGGPEGVHKNITDSQYGQARFYFTIVRNPYDRAASHFFMWRDNHKYFRTEVTLDDYVKALHERHMHPGRVEGRFRDRRRNAALLSLGKESSQRIITFQDRLFNSCSDWMTSSTAQDNLAIFKCEEMDKLENFFTKRLSITIPLKDIRVEETETRRLPSYKHLYSKESIGFIQEVYADDFRNLRYDP